MSRQCAVCAHPDRDLIERAIVAGEPNTRIARRCGISNDSVDRNIKSNHVRHTVAQLPLRAEESRRVESGDIVDKLQELITIAWDILTRSIDANQYSAAMSGVRELARIFELIARLTGQLDEGTRVNVLVQQQRQRDAAQELMLDRLTVAERL